MYMMMSAPMIDDKRWEIMTDVRPDRALLRASSTVCRKNTTINIINLLCFSLRNYFIASFLNWRPGLRKILIKLTWKLNNRYSVTLREMTIRKLRALLHELDGQSMSWCASNLQIMWCKLTCWQVTSRPDYLSNCLLYQFIQPTYRFAVWVQRRRGIVQQQYLWISHQRSCYWNSLLLSSTQLGALTADIGVVTLKHESFYLWLETIHSYAVATPVQLIESDNILLEVIKANEFNGYVVSMCW